MHHRLNRYSTFAIGTSILSYFLNVSPSLANTFLGDAGVVSNSLSDFVKNPANIAHIQDSQAGFDFSPIVWKSLDAQFQGLKPTKKQRIYPELTSFASPDNSPARFGKTSKNQMFGFSILAFPPVNLSQFASKVLIKDIPIFAFRQEDRVAAKIEELKLRGLLGLVAAYRFNNLTLGSSLRYTGAAVNGKVQVQESGDELFSFALDASTFALDWGLRWELIPQTLDFGFSGPLYAKNKATIDVDTGVLAQRQAIGPPNPSPLSRFIAGVRYRLDQTSLFFDLEYVKGSPEQGIALDDFRVGSRDVHDTVSPRLGLRYIHRKSLIFMGGYRYQPARYGDGNREPNGLIGFGALDLMLVYLDLEALTPYHLVAFGSEVKFWKRARSDDEDSPEFPWTFSYGLTYRVASRGVGPSGTMPGAFTENRLAVPIGITYRY